MAFPSAVSHPCYRNFSMPIEEEHASGARDLLSNAGAPQPLKSNVSAFWGDRRDSEV